MRTKPVKTDSLDVLLAALMPSNALACRLSLLTGLRISDVLAIKSCEVAKGRWTVTEGKTGKKRRVYVPLALRDDVMRQAGKIWAFPGRTNQNKHRTRQAVYTDIKRAAKLLRLGDGISPHSLRKTFAVKKYNACGDMRKVQELLNHKYEATTMLYALSDVLASKQADKLADSAKG